MLHISTPLYCTQALREKFLQEYPIDHPYHLFAWYLLMTGWVDKETGWPILSRKVVRLLSKDRRHHDSALVFIRDLSHVFPGLQHTYPDKNLGKARTVNYQFSKVLYEARRDNLVAMKEDKVSLVTGLPRAKREARKVDSEREEFVSSQLDKLDVPSVTRETCRLLNAQSSNAFTRMVKENFAYAVETAYRMNSPEKSLRELAQVQESPKVLYVPSSKGRTARSFCLGISLVSLAGPVRRAITLGCVEFDLTSAHLAIAARDWDIPELQALLSEGKSIWSYFDWPKERIKASIYSVLYGMTVKGLEAISPMGFMKHPLVKVLMAARRFAQRRIRSNGGVELANGTFLRLTKDVDVRSCLSQSCQMYEAILLLPVHQFIGLDRITFVAWQHDGFTVRFSDPREELSYTKKLEACVRVQAEKLGIITRLESRKVTKNVVDVSVKLSSFASSV